MDREVLRRLEKLNQLALTDAEKEAFLAFYAKQPAAAPGDRSGNAPDRYALF